MIERVLSRAARAGRLRRAAQNNPAAREVVKRFVPGDTMDDALGAVDDLRVSGRMATVSALVEPVVDRASAERIADTYVQLAGRLAHLGDAAELSVHPSALGLRLDDGTAVARELGQRICAAATEAGIGVTLDMDEHDLVDDTFRLATVLRRGMPDLGVTVQAALRRTEADCHDLARAGGRVRLVKGTYRPPASVAFTDPHEVDLSFVRCLRVLMAGQAMPLVGTHDPRLIEITGELARQTGRDRGDFEFQMLYGIRPLEQRRLVDVGCRVRVYVPFGPDWYAYHVERLSENPRHAWLFARSLVRRR